jgi:hypothetical protein
MPVRKKYLRKSLRIDQTPLLQEWAIKKNAEDGWHDLPAGLILEDGGRLGTKNFHF